MTNRVRGMRLGSGIGSGSATGPAPTNTATNTGVSFAAATSEIDEAMTGRVTLGVINFVVLAMVGFYVWTRSAQGGG